MSFPRPDLATASLLTPLLDHAARHTGDRAVIGPDGDADYGALVGRAVSLADSLRSKGVGPGDRVVVALTPGREAIASALAVFLLGAAYVPVDPDLPSARLAQLIEACQPAAILGDCPGGLEPHLIVGPWNVSEAIAPRLPSWMVRPGLDDVAYVIHTSGSTGAPKAIQVEHRSILNLLAAMDRRAPVAPGHMGSWWTSPGFDVAVWESWAPLMRGGSVAVVPPNSRLEVGRFLRFLNDTGVESAYVPPPFLPELAQALERDPTYGVRLRRLLVGVEPIPLGLLQRISRLRAELTVVNGYGPAEATVCCTLYVVPCSGGSPNDRAPIGTPIEGNRAFLVDAAGRPTSAATGELVIAGTGVARGYLRSVGHARNGFAVEDLDLGERAYRTGDLVRREPDGNMVFLERVDRQLKIRGHRIEPGEIEAAIRAVANVRDVVVGVRYVPGVGDALAAYVVPAPGAAIDPRQLIRELAESLPYYAVPSTVLPLDRLPQTTHGKVDYALLADMPLEVERHGPQPAAIQDWLTGLVWLAWCDELPGTASQDRGFVESGGASLSAARVAEALRRASGHEISALDVLWSASPGELAAALRNAQPVVVPGPRGRTEAPLGTREQAMLFHDRLNDGHDIYVEALAFRLGPTIVRQRLAHAIRRATAAHPAFGAAIEERDDGPWLILGRHRIELEQISDITLAAGEESATIGALVSGAVRASAGPLCRCLLVDHAEGGSVLVLVWHHAVVDSWSARLFLKDLRSYYYNPDYQAPRVRTTICDLLIDRESQAATPEARDALRTAVDRLTPAAMTTSGRPVAGGDDRFGRVPVKVDTGLLGQLRDQARHIGTTPFVALLAAYEQAVCDTFEVDATPIAIAVTDRWIPGSARIAGCLVDTLIHRGSRHSGSIDKPVLRECAAQIYELMRPTSRVPLPPLIAGLRAATRRPLSGFPTCYFGFDEEYRLELDGVDCAFVDIERQAGRFGVTLMLRQEPTSIVGSLEFRLWALSPDRAQQLVDRFLDSLAIFSAPA